MAQVSERECRDVIAALGPANPEIYMDDDWGWTIACVYPPGSVDDIAAEKMRIASGLPQEWSSAWIDAESRGHRCLIYKC